MFRRIGWQILLVGLGFLLAAGILAYLAATYTTEFRPAPGGTYVESVGGYPQTLNPLLSVYNDADSDVTALVFSGLTRLTATGEVEPDLARNWDINSSGLTYTFELRRDVLWHDGIPFTADDVVFTVGLLQDPDYPGPADLAALWQAVRVEKVNDYTVRFGLQEPFAPFLDYTTIGILPYHLLKGIQAADLPKLAFNRTPVGTGPFRLTEVAEAEGRITSVTCKRFSRYYGPQPYLENIILHFYPNARAALEAYESGLVEGVARIPPELLAEAARQPQLQFYSTALADMAVIYLNETLSATIPFDDNRVRQALFFGLDRQALVNEVLLGQALVPQTPFLPGTWAYNPEGVFQYTYDPNKALGLLLAAGWSRTTVTETLHNAEGTPLAFTLLAANEPQELATAQLIAEQWARLGISVTVQAVPPLALTGVLEARGYQAALVHLGIPGDPDPYPFWHETQALAGQNYAGFRHRRISEVVEQARLTTDRAMRLQLYHEFQDLFMKELPALPLYVPVYTYAVDKRVQGVQIGAMIMQTGHRFRSVAGWYVLQRRVVVGETP